MWQAHGKLISAEQLGSFDPNLPSILTQPRKESSCKSPPPQTSPVRTMIHLALRRPPSEYLVFSLVKFLLELFVPLHAYSIIAFGPLVLREEQLERITCNGRHVSERLTNGRVVLTSVFEPEEAEQRGIDEGNDEDQGIDLHSLACRRYVRCDEDEGKESTSQGAV